LCVPPIIILIDGKFNLVVYPSIKPPEISVNNQILIIGSITIDNHKLSLVIISYITTIMS